MDAAAAPLLEPYDYYVDDTYGQISTRDRYCSWWGSAGKVVAMVKMATSAMAEGACMKALRDVLMKEPLKTIHAMKMGLALLLAFLLVLVQPSYAQLGSHAIWAIMTVIVVFEFTIGATLSKGLNRGAGTLLAGLLAIVVGEVADMSTGSGVGHPILVGFIVFLVGGVVTFAKLWPSLKSYEFGLRTFLLTFGLITAAEYRRGDPLGTAINRFWIILLGAAIGVSVNVFVLPCWAGHDLHLSISSNFFTVADSLEVCVNEYLQGTILNRFPSRVFVEKTVDDPVYKRYRPILTSASKEESLAGFASWEPPHGRFKVVKYPWHQYVKVGAVLRHCTYSVVALHGCLQSGIQAPLKVRMLFEKEISAVGAECAHVLRTLGKQMENMQKGDPSTLLKRVEYAIDQLQHSLYFCSYLLVRGETGPEDDDRGSVVVSVLPEVAMPRNEPRIGSQVRSSDNLDLSRQTNDAFSDFKRKYSVKRTHSWPPRLKDQYDFAKEPYLEQKVRVLKSASALSVGTFATLLMEVALRLDYVAEAVQELSELAHFADYRDERDRVLKV